MLQLDVLLAVVFVGNLVHVLVDLLRRRIIVWPIWLGGEAVGIVVRGYVTFATGISIKLAVATLITNNNPPILEPRAP